MQVQVNHTIRGRDVLGDFDFLDHTRRNRPARGFEALEHLRRVVTQLPRRGGVAQFVGAFAEKSQAAAAHVQPGTHPVSVCR